MPNDRLVRRVADLLADAADAAAEEDWRAVRSLCDAVLALHPGHVEVRALLAQADAATAAAGERRQLTVMFCDVVGSTGFTQRRDPEVVRDVLRGYRDVLDDAVTRHEGYIAVWEGDGALIYFGHPRPHEDDAWRAVRAGLDLVEGLRPVTDAARREHDIDFAVRVAIHTGLVIRADMGTSSAPDHDAIVGETPAISARLQQKARPGTVLVTEATHDLVRGRFTVVPVGPFRLRGVERPIVAFEVQSDAPALPGVEVLADRGTAMVGRAAELAQLRTMWDGVAAGGHATALVRGDPGIGKTRLAAELRRAVLDDGGRALISACSTYQASTPLHPVRRLVEAAASIGTTTDVADAREQLRNSLAAFGREDALAVVADLLGFEAEPGSGPPELDPLRLREVTLDVLAAWMTAEAARAPILVVLDDIQWADPTTLELLNRVVAGRGAGLFLVMLARTGTRSLWSEATVPVLELAPLDDTVLEALVADLSGGTLDATAVASLVDRSDGVPLYAEELVRAELVAPEPFAPAPGGAVPASLRDPLLTRLAVTEGDLGLAQTIATVGDDVTLDLLSAIVGQPPATVAERAGRLVASRVLDEVTAEQPTFRFHHQLLAELAYDTQLLPVRRDRHARIASILRAAPEHLATTSSTTLAHHLEHAGLTRDAIDTYLVVSRDIQRRGSHTEAIQLLDHCVELLRDLDESERDSFELRVLHTRCFSVTSTIGYGAPQADIDFRRTVVLLRETPPEPEHELASVSAFSYFLVHGDLQLAEELNEQHWRNFEDGGPSSVMPVDAKRCLSKFFRGEFAASARDGCAFIEALDDPVTHPVPDAYPLPNELVATIAGTVGAARLLMLDPAGADEAADLVNARVEHLPFPFGPYSCAYAVSTLALGWYNARLEERALAAFALIRDVAERHGMSSYEILCNLQATMAEARFGAMGPDTIDRCEVLVEVWKATGLLTFVPCFGSVVATGRLEEGNPEASLAVTADCLAEAERMGARYWNSPLLCLRGEGRIAQGDEGGVDDVQRAAALAAEQGARLFELQARTALCRITADPIATKELRDFLDSVPADLDLPDVVDARTLLA